MRVRGRGPLPCEFAVVGSGPGSEEDRTGRAFVGRTGEELGRFFNGIDLPSLRDVFLTNLYREWGGKNYHYTAEDLRRDEPDLIDELQQCQPRIIVPLGAPTTRWFMGDVDLEAVQGIPFYWPQERLEATCGTLQEPAIIFPITHPASAFHSPELAAYVVSGFHEFARFLKGDVEPRKLFDDPYPNPHYEEITTLKRLETVLRAIGPTTKIEIDTEGWPGNPWSLQFTIDAGSGFLIHKSQPALLARAVALFHARGSRLVFHSALHDLGMGDALGCSFDGIPFDDTMVKAYLLQIEPQGLKALGTRHCNMRMRDYTDVLGDVSDRLALDYLTWVWEMEQIDHDARCLVEMQRLMTTPYRDAKGTLKPGRKLKVPPKLPTTALLRATKRVLQSKRPRSLWLDQVDDIQVAAYNRLGPMPEPTLDYVPREEAVAYACRDTDATCRVDAHLDRRLDALGLRSVYDLEIGTYPLIARMAKIGLKPDLPHFAKLSTKLQGEIDRLRTELGQHTGREDFNANSGDQVAEYLFENLKLESLKQTDSGRGSTNDKILEALEHGHPELPVLSAIRSYRELYKLKNTFVDRLPDFTHRWPHDGRIHAAFRTTRVVTGRLAASDPNLLAMPKHGKFAKDFRRGWVAEIGHILAEWDLSQIELRVLAHLSQDPTMLAIFRGEMRNPDGSWIDLHAALAQRIFGVAPKDQDKSKHRLPAKAINFGLPMGMTYKGLTVELRKNGVMVTEDDAQRWIDETMGLYKGVPLYQAAMKAQAKRNGYIRCLSGRIRYIGGIRASSQHVREEAGRFAFSTPIQEGAQWLMKQAEKRLYEDILVPYWRQGRYVEPLIQIHDALTLECEGDEDLAQDLNTKMVANMTMTPKGFSVPVETSGDWGVNWAEMEAF